MKVVYLHIMFWDMGEHYYGDLHRLGEPIKELKHPLTASEADRMNRRNRDGEHWEKGEEVRQFFSRDRVIKEAIKRYKEMFPGAIVLVHGSPGIYDPQTILDGPKEFMDTINELISRAEEIDGWDGDEIEMQYITEEWEYVWNAFMEE